MERINIYLNAGNQLRQAGKIAQVIEKYTQALQLNPDFVPALNQLAGIYESQKQFDQVLKYRQQVVQLQQDNAIAQANLAKTMEKQGNIEKAIAAYRKALAHESSL